MRVYVVVCVCKGVVSEVWGFIDPGETEMELTRLKQEYGIQLGMESESENDVQLHEIDIATYPISVAVRRQVI